MEMREREGDRRARAPAGDESRRLRRGIERNWLFPCHGDRGTEGERHGEHATRPRPPHPRLAPPAFQKRTRS